MHEYQLIEFNSDRKQTQLVSSKSNLQQVLAEFYKENFERCLTTLVVQKDTFPYLLTQNRYHPLKTLFLTQMMKCVL